MAKSPYLSIVTPVFNEEEIIPCLLAELTKACSAVGKEYEIVLVDDGSTDSTFCQLAESAQKDSHLKIAKLSRNFGHQAAFSAGLDFARGRLVMTMDGDLQHPPALIPEFVKYAEEGHDLIIGERLANEQNSRFREWLGRQFYRLLSRITNLEFRNVSDFVLYSRRAVETLKRLPEKERYLRGMIQWIGFNKKYLPYRVEKRRTGISKYTVKKLAKLVMSGVTSFSALPLRLSFWVGLLILLASIFFGIYVTIDHYLNPNPLLAGWATLVILVLFLGSIQLIILGVVGEYLYKMFNEIKGRPLYIVSETRNINPKMVKHSSYGFHALSEKN